MAPIVVLGSGHVRITSLQLQNKGCLLQQRATIQGRMLQKGRHAMSKTPKAAPTSRSTPLVADEGPIEGDVEISTMGSALLEDTKGFMEGELKRIFATGVRSSSSLELLYSRIDVRSLACTQNS